MGQANPSVHRRFRISIERRHVEPHAQQAPRHPQKVRHDMDLDTTPAVAFFNTAVEENRPRKFSKLWLRVQAWTFVPVTSGLVLLSPGCTLASETHCSP